MSRTTLLGGPQPAPEATQAPPRGAPEPGGGVSAGRAAGRALGLVALIVIGEYVARRVVGPWLPTLGSPVVNDMLAFVLCYTPLVALTAPPEARTPAAVWRTLRAIAAQGRTWAPWLGAVLFLTAVVALAPLDARLWGDFQLPFAPPTVPRSPVALLSAAAVPLTVGSMLLVNGLFVPLVEERLWRGLIQPDLRRAAGLVPGLVVTAALFSLKHAVVDASLGRLLAITVGGLVLGTVALRAGGRDGERTGWRASALSHAAANLPATALFLAVGAA